MAKLFGFKGSYELDASSRELSPWPRERNILWGQTSYRRPSLSSRSMISSNTLPSKFAEGPRWEFQSSWVHYQMCGTEKHLVQVLHDSPIKLSIFYMNWPAPPYEQDVTKFWAEFQYLKSEFTIYKTCCYSKVKEYKLPSYQPIERRKTVKFTLFLRAMWNGNSLVQDLNSFRRVHFLRR